MTTGRPGIDRAPYGRDGSLLRTADAVHEWRPNEPFRKSLTLRAPEHGGFGTYVVWEDSWGHRYPMFVSSLADLLLRSTVSYGVTVGWWTVIKRGKSYGICRLGIDEVARS